MYFYSILNMKTSKWGFIFYMRHKYQSTTYIIEREGESRSFSRPFPPLSHFAWQQHG